MSTSKKTANRKVTTVALSNVTVVLPDGGELSYDPEHVAKVGDRGIPETIHYRYLGNRKRPALTLRIQVRDGVPRVEHVSLDAVPDGAEIRPQDIKWGAADLGRMLRYWLTEVAYEPGTDGFDWVRRLTPTPAERRATAAEIERGRRPAHQRKATPKLLREIAAAYTAASTPKHVNVGQKFGMSPRNAQRYITKAREAGLLAPSARHRASK